MSESALGFLDSALILLVSSLCPSSLSIFCVNGYHVFIHRNFSPCISMKLSYHSSYLFFFNLTLFPF
jgi:hypothetical protein